MTFPEYVTMRFGRHWYVRDRRLPQLGDAPRIKPADYAAMADEYERLTGKHPYKLPSRHTRP